MAKQSKFILLKEQTGADIIVNADQITQVRQTKYRGKIVCVISLAGQPAK